jgi:hypothetical protein
MPFNVKFPSFSSCTVVDEKLILEDLDFNKPRKLAKVNSVPATQAVHGMIRPTIKSSPEHLRMDFHPRCGISENTETVEFGRPFIKDTDYNGKVAFVLEPLKVRPIMMGPAAEYFVLSQTQSFLWKNLRRKKQFRLISEPVTEEILNEVIAPHIKGCVRIHSGDYKSATDNFRTCFTLQIWNRICLNCGFEKRIRRLGAKCLVGHIINYDKNGKDKIKQTCGQSMGSPLSFPILCIMNLVICSLAYEWNWFDNRVNRQLDNLPVLINGDDCINPFTLEESCEWERIAKEAGMESSVGKTYFSSDFGQINSMSFSFDHNERKFHRVDYLNFSLCSSSVARGGTRRSWRSLPSLCEAWIHSLGPKHEQELLTYFIKSHLEEGGLLHDVPAGMSWWLPSHLGGLGLPVLDEKVKETISIKQHHLASLRFKEWEDSELSLEDLFENVSTCPRAVVECLNDLKHLARRVDLVVVDDENIQPGAGLTFGKNVLKAQQLPGLVTLLWDKYLRSDKSEVCENFTVRDEEVEIDEKGNIVVNHHNGATRQMKKLLKKRDKEILAGGNLTLVPLDVLIKHKKPQWEFPGGLETFLRKKYTPCSKNDLGELISAAWPELSSEKAIPVANDETKSLSDACLLMLGPIGDSDSVLTISDDEMMALLRPSVTMCHVKV